MADGESITKAEPWLGQLTRDFHDKGKDNPEVEGMKGSLSQPKNTHFYPEQSLKSSLKRLLVYRSGPVRRNKTHQLFVQERIYYKVN